MLARDLGLASRRELYERLDALELAEWEALYAIDPWGTLRQDLHAGLAASAAVSPWCKKGQVPRPTDYLLFANKKMRPKRRQSVAQQKAIVEMAAQSFAKFREREAAKKGNPPA